MTRYEKRKVKNKAEHEYHQRLYNFAYQGSLVFTLIRRGFRFGE